PDQESAEGTRGQNPRWLEWTTQERKKPGLDGPPSVGNFVLVRFRDEPGRDAAAAVECLNAQGIIPRRMGGYGLPDSLRITIGLEDDMRAVVEALSTLMK